ncbi:hypothetical protein ACWEK5_35435 [Rhodococcus koreensis]
MGDGPVRPMGAGFARHGIAKDLVEGERSRTAAEQFDITLRAEILADALIWLDFVLDVDLPDPPDMATAQEG